MVCGRTVTGGGTGEGGVVIPWPGAGVGTVVGAGVGAVVGAGCGRGDGVGGKLVAEVGQNVGGGPGNNFLTQLTAPEAKPHKEPLSTAADGAAALSLSGRVWVDAGAGEGLGVGPGATVAGLAVSLYLLETFIHSSSTGMQAQPLGSPVAVSVGGRPNITFQFCHASSRHFWRDRCFLTHFVSSARKLNSWKNCPWTGSFVPS